MRPTERGIRAAAALVLVAMLAALACPANADTPARPRRSGRYGRKGAEIWLEAPRYVLPTGRGYKGDYDIEGGVGFGFGVMFAFSDNLALEGRIVQTTHDLAASELAWDMDQALVGVRYGFMYDRALQPYVGLGGARVSLEWDRTDELLTEFRRTSGYGVYATLGVDYILSNRWVAGFRIDYVEMKYAEVIVGTDNYTLDDAIDGSSFGASLSIHYRVPVWW